jgi:hypothetical protein
MSQCKYCQTHTTGPAAVCDDCRDIIETEQQNLKDGLCPKCKGSCQEIDGTPCTECEGFGILQ